MATFKVVVHNKSASIQNYMFFNAPPEQVFGSKLYSNVWVTKTDVDTPNGTATLTVQEKMFAVCGTAPSPLAEGVTVSSSDYAEVQLTQGSTGGTIAAAEAANANIFVGHGKDDGTGNIVPVATWVPSSLSDYTVQPQVVFYIATGDYQQGTCVDVTGHGPVGKVDFAQAKPGQLTADITQYADNSWGEPVFS
ncbi:uncharacterized protein EI97DRAFT_414273 [Westerdykella ornata]|uniref:Uncharacterized protein n=1 Tax=Westerdykella ornata TaxID=318751 RepID=A0A6A6JSP2_WESOR|nr:uncharacterized protein EI97DRAFT_414273 [Westerdykella ornata]KAF2279133.1 hypothetical protein EI97DRAFT_414273 [Westerdykella ornata]